MKMSLDDSTTTLEDVVDTPRTSAMKERRRKARVLSERMVLIQGELKKLGVDMPEQRKAAANEPSQGTGGSGKSSSDSIVEKRRLGQRKTRKNSLLSPN